MHYLVRLIVEADNTDEAKGQAENVMDNLIEWHEFDWYQTSADSSRWPECWKPMRLTNKKAQALVADAMQGQLEEFKRSMETIRTMVANFTDEQIFEEDFGDKRDASYSRWQFSRASGYHANACQLFDNGGCSITNQKQLDWYLKEPKGLWVVQVDAHN